MAGNPPIPLRPILISLHHPIFREICQWPFADPFVSRILRDDVPQRMRYGHARIWIYCDPSDQIVGLGVIDYCRDYAPLSEGKLHPHIPLIAVNPACQGRGHGKYIVNHLIREAGMAITQPNAQLHDVMFLEVYVTSTIAITLYEKCGFGKLRDEPMFDPEEQQSYFIMVKKVSVSQPPQAQP